MHPAVGPLKIEAGSSRADRQLVGGTCGGRHVQGEDEDGGGQGRDGGDVQDLATAHGASFKVQVFSRGAAF